MQIVEGIRGIFTYLKAKVGESFILSEDVISYGQDKALDDYDLVYKRFLMDEIESISDNSPKSLLMISGNITIDWESVATDDQGDPRSDGAAYIDLYGEYPKAITCYVPDGTGAEAVIQLQTERLANGNFRINADGLTDVVVIIS